MNSCLIATAGTHFLSSILLAPTAFFPIIYWACEPVWGYATSVCVSTFIGHLTYSLLPLKKLSKSPKLLRKFNKIKDGVAFYSSKERAYPLRKIVYCSLFIPLVFAPPLLQGLFIKLTFVSKVKSFMVILLLQVIANGAFFGSILLGYTVYETLDPSLVLQ